MITENFDWRKEIANIDIDCFLKIFRSCFKKYSYSIPVLWKISEWEKICNGWRSDSSCKIGELSWIYFQSSRGVSKHDWRKRKQAIRRRATKNFHCSCHFERCSYYFIGWNQRLSGRWKWDENTGKLKVSVKNKTVIIISHRMKSIEKADKIVVMHQGKVESIGRHEELLKYLLFIEICWKNQIWQKTLCTNMRIKTWFFILEAKAVAFSKGYLKEIALSFFYTYLKTLLFLIQNKLIIDKNKINRTKKLDNLLLLWYS